MEWLTPPFILKALGPFDLDPCAMVDQPWPTAARHYTIRDNGLLRPWMGRVWLNSPYGDQTALWLARLAGHGIGTALVFARTETEAFFAWVWRHASALLFLQGRLHFHRPDGRRAKRNCGAPSVLVAYGGYDAERLGDSRLAGQFVPLAIPRTIALLGLAAADSNFCDSSPACLRSTWRELVVRILDSRGPVRLDEIYRALRAHPKARANPHWREQIRKVLQQGGFRRVSRGVWSHAMEEPVLIGSRARAQDYLLP